LLAVPSKRLICVPKFVLAAEIGCIKSTGKPRASAKNGAEEKGEANGSVHAE
jgi:hypothetical protein